MATKIYENTTKQPVTILGVGEISPGERVSVSGEYLPPVNLDNYPGVVDVVAEEEAAAAEEEAKKGGKK